MKTVNLNRTWDNITAEIHRTRSSHHNLVKKEVSFGLQILLSQYELAKNEKNRELIKFYSDIFESCKKHNISRCVVWGK